MRAIVTALPDSAHGRGRRLQFELCARQVGFGLGWVRNGSLPGSVDVGANGNGRENREAEAARIRKRAENHGKLTF